LENGSHLSIQITTIRYGVAQQCGGKRGDAVILVTLIDTIVAVDHGQQIKERPATKVIKIPCVWAAQEFASRILKSRTWRGDVRVLPASLDYCPVALVDAYGTGKHCSLLW
jgi:hypothetical protein